MIASTRRCNNRPATVPGSSPVVEFRPVSVDGVPTVCASWCAPEVMRGFSPTNRPGDLQPPPDGWTTPATWSGSTPRLRHRGRAGQAVRQIAGRLVPPAGGGGGLVTAGGLRPSVVANLPDPKGPAAGLRDRGRGADRRAAAEAGRGDRTARDRGPAGVPMAKTAAARSGKVDLPACAAWRANAGGVTPEAPCRRAPCRAVAAGRISGTVPDRAERPMTEPR